MRREINPLPLLQSGSLYSLLPSCLRPGSSASSFRPRSVRPLAVLYLLPIDDFSRRKKYALRQGGACLDIQMRNSETGSYRSKSWKTSRGIRKQVKWDRESEARTGNSSPRSLARLSRWDEKKFEDIQGFTSAAGSWLCVRLPCPNTDSMRDE